MLPAAPPAVSRAVCERGQHFAEILVLLNNGVEEQLRGPARSNQQSALKDCLELRKVAIRCCDDPSLFKLRQRKKELEEITWTVKDIGGRLLDGAEGPPPGYRHTAATELFCRAGCGQLTGSAARAPAATKGAGKAAARGQPRSQECTIEVADTREVVAGRSGEAAGWEQRAKVALQQAFKRFGPILEVRMEEGAADGEFASVRFASARAAETAMSKALQGYLPVGDGHVRVRRPASADAAQREFPPPRQKMPAIDSTAPSRKRLRPNERFAQKGAGAGGDAEPDKGHLEGPQAASGGSKPRAPDAPAPEPERPTPSTPGADALEEDLAVARFEKEVSLELTALLEKPFSQQRKALKTLLLRWHPDKNPERPEVATRVFQFLQAHEAWLGHHGLSL